MGHCRRCVARGGSRREGQRFFGAAVPARRADDFGHQRNHTRRNAEGRAGDFAARSCISTASIDAETTFGLQISPNRSADSTSGHICSQYRLLEEMMTPDVFTLISFSNTEAQ